MGHCHRRPHSESRQATRQAGRECLVLNEPERPGHGKLRSIWVDPSQDYAIVRVLTSYRGAVVGRSDVSYREDARSGWIPKHWEIVEMDITGGLKWSRKSEVVHVEINPTFDSWEVRLDFPVGTIVTDTRTGEHYLQREGDTKRVITDEERVQSRW